MPIRINPRYVQSNPLYWSASAIVDDAFVVKYAWSEVRATRLWREGELLRRLRQRAGVAWRCPRSSPSPVTRRSW